MDIRPMRPEKWRTAYVAWVDAAGEVSVDAVSVRDWCVVSGVWRPAFRYGGAWVWPQTWSERWPHRALLVADPGARRPSDQYLALRAQGVREPRRVVFVAGTESAAEDTAARTAAQEELARLRAYPPERDTFDPGDPGWWLPATAAEADWIDAITDDLYTYQICAPRRLRAGRDPGEPTHIGNRREGFSKGRYQSRSDRPDRPAKLRGNRESPDLPACPTKSRKSDPIDRREDGCPLGRSVRPVLSASNSARTRDNERQDDD